MFNCTISGITCKFSLLFPAVLLLLLVLDGDGVALFCFSAAFLHESAHGIALCFCRIKPRALTLSFFGMRLDLPPRYQMTLLKTGVVAAAGPLCNVCCAIILKGVGAPQSFAAAHLVLAVLNSFPVMPLDGGQITAAVCERVFSERVALRLENILFWLTWGILVFLGTAVFLHSRGNFTLFAVAVYIGMLHLFYKCD